MMQVVLVHWNEAEALERLERIRRAGYQAAPCVISGPGLFKRFREDPPLAVVIDLDRLPMQGRDVGIGLRHRAWSRHLPLVFVEGEPAKVERIRAQLPDAVYSSWRNIGKALKTALGSPPVNPVKPTSVLAGYSGTPLPRKLGIKPKSRLGLIGAPDGFEQTLGELPDGATIIRQPRGMTELTLWFTRSLSELEKKIARMVPRGVGGGLWIIWPKQTSALGSDVTEKEVRRVGLAAGLVDFKVCAVDETWSGLRFSRRK